MSAVYRPQTVGLESGRVPWELARRLREGVA